ncbi:UTRA domain-containing protein [Nonomuraea salmonea]|uniref:UTRA domain-containing protein n=1 Tax=Nonomuraea salmonea TaxID=46181 RepID=UPI002FECF418
MKRWSPKGSPTSCADAAPSSAPCPNAAPSSSPTETGPTSPPPGNHPDVQAFGWDLAQRDHETPLFTGEKTIASRDVAIMLGVRPGHPVIHRRSMWHRGHTAAIHGASARLEINSYTNADMLPDYDDPKRHAQYRKRPGFFYQSLIREHGPVRWMTLTTARIAYEDERAALGMDYAEAVLIIRRTMAHPNGHPIEVTEVKAPPPTATRSATTANSPTTLTTTSRHRNSATTA